ncbi:hypothetical protein V2J09_004085, partial [Rumex salicifolius]
FSLSFYPRLLPLRISFSSSGGRIPRRRPLCRPLSRLSSPLAATITAASSPLAGRFLGLVHQLISTNMGSKLQIHGDESILLHVTHSNIKSFNADIRFSLQTTVGSAKEKLWKKTGTSVDSMRLELYDDSGTKIADLFDDAKPLGFYSPFDGYRLHIIDLDPSSVTSGGWLEDTSLVEKYTISDEAYEKRDGTFRKFKERFGHQNSASDGVKIEDSHMEDLCVDIKVGDRCKVEPGDKRGVVKYVGRAENLGSGFWVGVEYDEPLGKHDGMVKGKRFFECPRLHGTMVRSDKVKVGDYPEHDPFEEDEI